ncbi:biopolymer transporter ExbD [Burkholderia cepacia JBK9]|uniref:Biopolymer transporter ExbD n=1 Tax=Burkholderia arboris TaxID=488730 RepID=A0A9Q9SH87_9BURK|nr:biopolymer transporter ExbD [Burkholderia arboris]ALX15237.1 biopolymer transporter ExbD [Burkholderia cepacia JBK9]MCA8490763.1 biopolymer transporter ExbD [Burkholderia arboris]UTV59613.1 biopolymer transporter ExbD [Burkholderia arboris]VWB53458.1 biopolymer transporter ExbD [Burkholderia arboris]
MGMNVSSGSEPDVMVDINTTPLIDVMLVLLIMLIITIPIQMHAVRMNLPVGAAPPAAEPEVVQIDVAADGATAWNGTRLPDRAALEAKLAQVAAEPVQAELRLRPDRQAPYRDVAAVLASAQRVGATKIGLMGNEQYVQ